MMQDLGNKMKLTKFKNYLIVGGEKKEKKNILQMSLQSKNKCSITANGCKYTTFFFGENF
jgi:hypothetical protein